MPSAEIIDALDLTTEEGEAQMESIIEKVREIVADDPEPVVEVEDIADEITDGLEEAGMDGNEKEVADIVEEAVVDDDEEGDVEPQA